MSPNECADGEPDDWGAFGPLSRSTCLHDHKPKRSKLIQIVMASSDEEALSAADLEALKAAEEEDAAEEQRRLDLARRERDDEERAADEARAAASSAENSRDGLFGTALPGPREHAPPRARDESRAGGRFVGGRFVGGRGVGGRGRGGGADGAVQREQRQARGAAV